MKAHTPRICALVSGGLDSALLLQRLLGRGAAVQPVYVRCGLSWEAAELWWLRRLLDAMRSPRLLPLRVVSLPLGALYGRHWSLTGRRVPGAHSPDRAVYLPGRNVFLLSLGALVCAEQRCSAVALGVLQGNPFGDATPRFFRRMAAALSEALGRPLRILAPLRGRRKPALLLASAGVPLGLTFSCIHPAGRRHCGQCNKCAERRRAFRAARLPDPTDYA